MSDAVMNSWLAAQYQEAMSFSMRSDVLRLAPVEGDPPHRYLAEFHCDGLIDTGYGIELFNRHLVGITFPALYLREPTIPGLVLTWLDPKNSFHPNIHPPHICAGDITPGMSLLSLLHQLYQMITWQRFTPREDDALNPEACSWARSNMERFPIDARRSMLKDAVIDEATTRSPEHE